MVLTSFRTLEKHPSELVVKTCIHLLLGSELPPRGYSARLCWAVSLKYIGNTHTVILLLVSICVNTSVAMFFQTIYAPHQSLLAQTRMRLREFFIGHVRRACGL